MPEKKPPRFDPDERFKLDTEPEEVVRRLLDGDKRADDDQPSEEDEAEDT